MATKIILMNNGQIQQIASPREIYNHPVNLFTAQFIGSPQMNTIRFAGSEACYGFRPEKVTLSQTANNAFYVRKGSIVTKEMLGSETIYQIRYDDQSVMVKSLDDSFETDSDVYISVDKKDIHIFDEEHNAVSADDSRYAAMIAQL